MAELLSREKELFKINQQLNMMATNTVDGGNAYPLMKCDMDKTAAIILTEPRYGTYHKQKGPSTLLKKKAAEVQAVANKFHATDSFRDRTLTRASHKPKINIPARNVAAATAASGGKAREASALVVATAAPCPGSTLLTKAKTPDGEQMGRNGANSPPRIGSKFSTFTRGQVSKTATFVKYRNPNFTESPSLEEFLRNNCDNSQLVELEITEERESTTVMKGNTKKHLSQDNFIKFLKAKMAIVEEDHARLTHDMASQTERLEQSIEAQRRADNQRDQALNTNKQLTEQLRKAEQQIEEASRRSKERQLESSSQQREFEQMKRDLRLLKQTNANLENRLGRSQEELESMRQTVSKVRGEQRDQQEAARNEVELKDRRIKALKRQRTDLLNAYKKQLYMIDNLKRQTNCMEQSLAVGLGEKEFNKVLEWNTKA